MTTARTAPIPRRHRLSTFVLGLAGGSASVALPAAKAATQSKHLCKTLRVEGNALELEIEQQALGIELIEMGSLARAIPPRLQRHVQSQDEFSKQFKSLEVAIA